MQCGTGAGRGWLLHDFQTNFSLWGRGTTVLAQSYPLGAFYPFTKPSPSCARSSPPGQLTFLTRLCTRFQQPPGKSLQQLSVGRLFFFLIRRIWPTVRGIAATLPVRPFHSSIVAPWRGANWICCHLPKLPGAHVCSGYRWRHHGDRLRDGSAGILGPLIEPCWFNVRVERCRQAVQVFYSKQSRDLLSVVCGSVNKLPCGSHST